MGRLGYDLCPACRSERLEVQTGGVPESNRATCLACGWVGREPNLVSSGRYPGELEVRVMGPAGLSDWIPAGAEHHPAHEGDEMIARFVDPDTGLVMVGSFGADNWRPIEAPPQHVHVYVVGVVHDDSDSHATFSTEEAALAYVFREREGARERDPAPVHYVHRHVLDHPEIEAVEIDVRSSGRCLQCDIETDGSHALCDECATEERAWLSESEEEPSP